MDTEPVVTIIDINEETIQVKIGLLKQLYGLALDCIEPTVEIKYNVMLEPEDVYIGLKSGALDVCITNSRRIVSILGDILK